MNSTSALIVIVATLVGAIALYFGVSIGMNASDDYASRLSINSTEYLRQREKALADGKDPTKIGTPAARTQKPASYDESLASAETSPYVRADSDEPQATLIAVEKESDAITELKNELIASRSTRPPTEDTATDKESTDDNSVDDDDDATYTVDDEIRHQLATVEMSDEKRETLESLLPQSGPEPVRAVDVRMTFDTNSCVVPRNSNSWIGVMFRHESSAIRGTSLTELDDLVRLRERCNGTLVIEDYAAAQSEIDIKLRETRRDEVKYYLLQSQVPKDFIQIDNL